MSYKVSRNGKLESLQFKKIGFLKPQEIWLGDELLGTWPKARELNKGVVYTAKDGSKLELKMKAVPAELQIIFNDQLVEGSAGHPETRIKTAYTVMAVICVLNLLIGTAAIVTNSEALLRFGFGVYNLVVGGIFLIMLAIGYKDKMFWPLAIGLFVFFLDAIMMLRLMIEVKMTPNVGPIIVRAMIIIPWFRGCVELYKKNKKISRNLKATND